MTAWICRTCATQQPDTAAPPDRCEICEDERQYVGPGGQQWTSLAELRAEGRTATWAPVDPDLFALRVAPKLGIGQQGLLVCTVGGNALWDPPGYLDEAAIDFVRDHGGLVAVATSHPHLQGVQVEWSEAFGGVPVLVNAADQEWTQRPSPAVTTWSGQLQVVPGVTLVQCGGHFPGSAVLHWAAGADGAGALATGDTVSVCADDRWVTFMRSYPNTIPLSAAVVRRIAATLAGWEFQRLYNAWGDCVRTDAGGAVQRSAERYARWVIGDFDDLT